MKRILILIMLLYLGLHSADAQWYTRKCEVTDYMNSTYEEFNCLWWKAKKGIRTHAIITGGGLIFAGTAALVAPQAFVWGGTFYNVATFISVPAAFIGLLWGTPGLITWAVRKSNLKYHPHYRTMNTPFISLIPEINRMHQHEACSLGVKISLRF